MKLFDPESESLLRQAPAIAGLSSERLPERFTEAYAQLTAARVRGSEIQVETPEDGWSLAGIADVYELIATTSLDNEIRVPAAFVAATAQQLLAQAARPLQDSAPSATPITRDAVAPEVAAPLLFLIAKQYADAADAAMRIIPPDFNVDPFGRRLLRAIVLLSRGRIARLASLPYPSAERSADLYRRSEEAVQMALLRVVKQMASSLLGARDTTDPRELIEQIIAICDGPVTEIGQTVSSYPGYQQLARLLLRAFDAFEESALVRVPTPPRVDADYWQDWTVRRAAIAPFVWPNHTEAVDAGFHHPGTSAVLVLPTGAGKTTLASMKIASALGQGSRVVVLAPTHSLVEQLRADFGAVFIADTDATDPKREEGHASISVMTPEHCLALMSFNPSAFEDVSLIVFDEAHLLSMEAGTRRSIDAMLAVLLLTRKAPSADLLLLSAMLRNGAELAAWLGTITGRPSLFFAPTWKPSRQARGVVMYQNLELESAIAAANQVQLAGNARAGSTAVAVRVRAREQLRVTPYGLFGLEHNWLNESTADVTIQRLVDHPVELTGKLVGGRVQILPGVNQMAIALARATASSGLKSIVFANVKSHTVSVARELRNHLPSAQDFDDEDGELWDDLAIELGGLEYAFNAPGDSAVCHNGLMLRVERVLAERAFKRKGGAHVIVATPTLAQGMNLPADVAILASEMRASARGREALAAHELMNAAARAGRAGHVANGLVLLISETVLGFDPSGPLSTKLVGRLKAILPTDDRSIELVDPLQVVLDRLSAGRTDEPDVDYLLNRLSSEDEPDSPHSIGIAERSFAGFQATRAGIGAQFQQQIQQMQTLVAQRSAGLQHDDPLLVASAQTGLAVEVLIALKNRLQNAGTWPETIRDWISWIFDWLGSDAAVRYQLFGNETGGLSQSVGQALDHELTAVDMELLRDGIHAWMSGAPVNSIERALGGPVEGSQMTCMRARSLITKAVPLSISFSVSVVALVARTLGRSLAQNAELALDCLLPAVREGFDRPALVAFAQVEGRRSLRVRKHLNFATYPALPILEDQANSLEDLIPLVRWHLLHSNS